MRPSHLARTGFTLIELLVVVSVIAVLLGILLPTLGAARESARLSQCLSNVRQLTIAGQTYALDNKNLWPVVPARVIAGSGNVVMDSFSYGGKTSADFWRTYAGGASYHTIAQRPLNRWAYPDVTPIDPTGGRTDLPIYRCPSDVGTYQRSAWSSITVLDPSITCYDDVGTSYHMNTRWWSESIRRAQADNTFTTQANLWLRMNRMFARAQERIPSRFVWLHDQVFDIIAYGYGISRPAEHGGKSKGTAAFMDGHADYTEVVPRALDTDKYTLILYP